MSIGARRQLLKQTTLDLHEQLEQQYPFVELVQGRVTLESYCQALMVLWGFYHTLETQVRPFCQAEQLFKGRFKTELLECDLRELGCPPPRKPMPILEGLNSLASVLGVWYVFEGATLGGARLLKLVQSELRLPAAATNFYGVYGRDRGRRWQEFCEYLETVVLTESEQAEMVETAGRVFQRLIEWTNLMDSGATMIGHSV